MKPDPCGTRPHALSGPSFRRLSRPRLEALHRALAVLAELEDVAQTLACVLTIAGSEIDADVLILRELDEDGWRAYEWHAPAVTPKILEDALGQAVRASALLVREEDAPRSTTCVSALALGDFRERPSGKCLTLPLVVARGAPFGVLQIRCRPTVDENDLTFVFALAHHVSVALDRGAASGRDGRHARTRALDRLRREHGLTPAETTIVERVVRGLSNKEVAGALGSSPATVRTHLLNTYRKVHVASRAELANAYFDESHRLR